MIHAISGQTRRTLRNVKMMNWLIRLVRTNPGLVNRAQRYVMEREARDHAASVRVLRLIRRSKIYSAKTTATNLREALIRACADAKR